MNKKIIIGVIVALIVGLVVGYVVHTSPVQQSTVKGITSTSNIQALTSKIGTGCDNGFSTCVGVVTYGGILSTSTPASITLQPTDLQYGYISMYPGTTAGITITLPATTTSGMSNYLPNAGDNTSFILFNSTTTASRTITIAAGTGTLVETSTSTAGAISGRSVLVNCFRKVDTDIVCDVDPFL